MAASVVVSHAEALQERLPKVGAVLAAGDTDWRTVQLIIVRTELVSASAIACVDSNLAGRIAKWHCWSASTGRRCRRRRGVRTIDPDANIAEV